MRSWFWKGLRLVRCAAVGLSAALACALLLDLPLSHIVPHGYRRKAEPLPGDDPAKVTDTSSWVVTADHGIACLTMDGQHGPAMEVAICNLPVGPLSHGEVTPYRFRRTLGFYLDVQRQAVPWGSRWSFVVALPHWALAVIAGLPCLPLLIRIVRKRGTAPGGFPVESPTAVNRSAPATPLPVQSA